MPLEIIFAIFVEEKSNSFLGGLGAHLEVGKEANGGEKVVVGGEGEREGENNDMVEGLASGIYSMVSY